MPQNAHALFHLPAQGGWIDIALANKLKRMVDFRDITLHGDQTQQLEKIVNIIEKHLEELRNYSRAL